MLQIIPRTPSMEHLMFGGSTIGCLYSEVDENQAKDAVQAALSAGITKYDTAPLYGSGLSETRLGLYLPNEWNGRKIWLSTKCGRVIKTKDELESNDRVEYACADKFATEKYHRNLPVAIYTWEGVMESVRQSKERLQRDHFDCLRLHDAETEERFTEACAPGGAVDTMIELKQQGVVGEVSLGMNSSEYLLRYVRRYPKGTFDNIMVAGCWNLIDQDGYDLLLECQEKGIKVTNVGIFASGLLVGSIHYKYDSNIPPQVVQKLNQWTDLCKKYNVKIINVAVSFALLPCVVENVAIGMRDAGKVEANTRLFDGSSTVTIPIELWKEAQEQGLIRKELNF